MRWPSHPCRERGARVRVETQVLADETLAHGLIGLVAQPWYRRAGEVEGTPRIIDHDFHDARILQDRVRRGDGRRAELKRAARNLRDSATHGIDANERLVAL